MSKVKARVYNPYQIELLLRTAEGRREVRRSYSELRKIANKRISRLEKAGFRTFRKKNKRFSTLAEIKSDQALKEALSELSKYIRTEGTTVREAKEQRTRFLEAMRERKLYYFNEENYNDALDFFDDLHGKYEDMVYDSGDAVELYNETLRLNISPKALFEHYDFFKKNQTILESLDPKASGRRYRFSEVKDKIERRVNKEDTTKQE